MPVFVQTIQRNSVISFPGLGIFGLNPPASFVLFGRTIYFYGVLIAFGFIFAMVFCARNSRRFGIDSDTFYDLMLRIIPLTILGARIYYVLFRLEDYLDEPLRMFAVWEGGLAIYGGILMGLLTVFIFCRRRHIPVAAMVDLCIYGLLPGQIIGRWGNFLNREAFGAETEIFCRMGLTDPAGNTIFVHPTFLYESLWNLACFIFLLVFLYRGRRKYDGQCSLIYFFWYGLGRAWIEGLRSDSLYLGNSNIRVSQALSIALAILALTLLLIQSRREHPPESLYVNRVRAEKAAQETAPQEETN